MLVIKGEPSSPGSNITDRTLGRNKHLSKSTVAITASVAV